MASPKITLYYDIVSPFAYIAFKILQNSATFSKCEVTFVPIFLGGLMNASGNTPPIKIKNKDKWINLERLRWARYFSVPISEKTPEGFPHLTLAVQRALTAVSQQTPDKLTIATEAIWQELWAKGNGKATQSEVFVPILEKVLGSSKTKAVLEAANGPEIKARLSANTQQAFDSGAFGLPWFECTNCNGEKEGFWGVDHLGQVVDFLGLDSSQDRGFRAVL
ncbi:putative 2-hydroxychromene-2-carboxylate isomerase [Aspergillus undulatus]|uniref:putative 2-hydroxychromene-2-carboxylate isomerase n=1 Tax=Aspergillus undulatus TaxID=1810928 RepID=UPI003CCDDDA4